MRVFNPFKKTSAAAITASTFGVLGGLVHGIGEVLQGNARPDGIFISSWAQGPIALYLDGDPAITIIPNFLFTGMVTLVISVFTMLWAIAFMKNKTSGIVLLLLSLAGLFSGSGVGPPTIGILAGISGLGIGVSYPRSNVRIESGLTNIFASSWPWIFGIAVANGIFLVIGHVVAVYFFVPVNAAIFQNSFIFAVIIIVLTIITGRAYDKKPASAIFRRKPM